MVVIMYNLWATKWLCGKACESEIDYLWQNICGSNNVENYNPWQTK